MLFVSVFVLLLATAGVANAIVYSMTGEWFLNRTSFIDIPIKGGPAPCLLDGGAGIGPNGVFNPKKPGCLGILTTIPVQVGAEPILGGVPGSAASISAMGLAPASFTVPPYVFNTPAPIGGSTVAVAARPTVVQLGTSFSLMGPATSRAVAPPANTRNFRKSAHLAQTGRVGANFSWCAPGQSNCAGAATYVAPYVGRVVCNAGPNAFGGTMSIVGQGVGEVHVITGAPHAAGPLGGTKSVLAQPLAGVGSQAQGRGYASLDSDMLAGGQINVSYNTNFPCTGGVLPPLPPGCGQIKSLGATNGVGPKSTNMNWGFPWTTGSVSATNIETIGGGPGTTTLTAMGADYRNALGKGNIVMVAGGITYRGTQNTNFVSIDVVSMNFIAPVPALSTPGLAAVGALIVLAAGYALRRRL
jgi:hypothetical protein